MVAETDKILPASIITYGVGTDKGVNNWPGANLVGLINQAKSFQAGEDNIDACYVGETANEIILAFRGTLPRSEEVGNIEDWLNNFNAKTIQAEGFPGEVHQGFHASVINLQKKGFVEEVKTRLFKTSKTLVVTGYSKGAALAPLASFVLRNEGVKVDQICIFEPPRCGNEDFVEAFNEFFPTAIRYEYQDDIVPHLPPKNLFLDLLEHTPLGPVLNKVFGQDVAQCNYESVGNLKFIKWNNDIVDDSKQLEVQRFVRLSTTFVDNPKQLWQDHLPCTGIFGVICPDHGACPWE